MGNRHWVAEAITAAVAMIATIRTPPLRAQTGDTTRTVTVPAIVVEAFRTPTFADSVPYTLSVAVPAEGRSGLALDETLFTLPGVQADDRYNYAVGDRISIRGFGARTQFGVRGIRVISDDVPVTFADGQSALEIVDPAAIERGEVIRGPASALYGNAAGGVILLRSWSPSAQPLHIATDATLGGYGLIRTGMNIEGNNGPFDYALSTAGLGNQGYRLHSDATTYRAGARVDYHANTEDRLWMSGAYVDFSADNPGALSQSLAMDDPRQAYSGNVKQEAGKKGHQLQGGGGWSHLFGQTGMALRGYVIGRDVTNPISTQIIDLKRIAAGGSLLLHGSLGADGTGGHWLAGADLDAQMDDRRNNVNNGGIPGELSLDQRERVMGLGAYSLITLPVTDVLQASGGLRYDRTSFHVQDHLISQSDPDDSGDRTMDALSPSAGIIWFVVPEFNIYGNIATAFETPTTTELANRPDGSGGFNPDLKPQHALSYELALRGKFGRMASYQMSLFDVEITNELIPFQVPGSSDRDFFRNAGSSTHRGAELSLELLPVPGGRVQIGYSYVDARYASFQVNEQRFDGNRVPGISPGRLETSLSWYSPQGWYVGLDSRSVAPTPVNDANSERAAGYTVANMRVGLADLTIAEGAAWRYTAALYTGVNNIFDSRYIAAVTVNAFGGRYYEPGPGRMFYVGVRLDAGKGQ